MKDKLISELGEKKLIQILLEKRDSMVDDADKKVKNSYHDDAALINNSSKYTVISTDMLIQHSHFPKTMTPYQMGEKIVTVNVSDILAMNATPTSILVSMGLPPEMKLEEYERLTDGILDKCREYEITLIGGDINQNTEIILSGTSVGHVDDKVKLQTDIKENDLIAITGELGGPAAALDLIYNKSDICEDEKINVIKSLLEPDLPIKQAGMLRKYPDLTTSITDITDGLAVELGHLHDKNSSIGFEINYDMIPYNKTIEKVAKINNKELTEYLLHFGEEFELLLTLDEKEFHKHEDELENLHIIGKCNNSGKITLIKDGIRESIANRGYEHLKDD